jgi:salicylate hydroxylase
LLQWGLKPFLEDHVVEPEGITFRRWQDGRAIAFTRYVPDFQEKYKAPYYVVHRAHFHEALYKRALELGVEIRVAHKVVDYDQYHPSVTLQDGTIFKADLVVAADGIRLVMMNFDIH